MSENFSVDTLLWVMVTTLMKKFNGLKKDIYVEKIDMKVILDSTLYKI